MFQTALRWDIFCRVIDNHGDLGVCWRLSADLAQRGQTVRLWVDDASALAWMAPRGHAGVSVHPWPQQAQAYADCADVVIEAFGCELPESVQARIAQATAARRTPDARPPAWLNLEYLSAEAYVARQHGLPSPVMQGPAKGCIKSFFFPGFTKGTGGLLREIDLQQRQLTFDRTAWRAAHAPKLPTGGRLISLFCYEPVGLPELLHQLSPSTDLLLVTPGRAHAAVTHATRSGGPTPQWLGLTHTDQQGFDQMLWACDLNFVRGEDSLVRALWAGQPFVWHIYPQHDDAHHAKLEAFLDWLQAPASLRQFHRVWNGVTSGALPLISAETLAQWGECVRAAQAALVQQSDLTTQLIAFLGPLTAHPAHSDD